VHASTLGAMKSYAEVISVEDWIKAAGSRQ